MIQFKKITSLLSIASLTGVMIFISCKKEYSCEGCAAQGTNPTQQNHPPVARAGADQTIYLPTNTTDLDGSGSTDPDSNITSYAWTKISGPSAFDIVDANATQTQVTGIIEGSYLFELKVTDAGGLVSKDTIMVSVVPMPLSQIGNLLFFFPDPTGSVTTTYGIPTNPTLNLVVVKIANYPDGYIGGVWCKTCSPRCPISTDYSIELGNYTAFTLPAGTYTWTAESFVTNFAGYPLIPPSFQNFMAVPHSTGGTITVQPNQNCIIKAIIF